MDPEPLSLGINREKLNRSQLLRDSLGGLALTGTLKSSSFCPKVVHVSHGGAEQDHWAHTQSCQLPFHMNGPHT